MGQQTFRGDFRSMFLDALRASLEVSTFSEAFTTLFDEEVSRYCAIAAKFVFSTHIESCAVFAAAYSAMRAQGTQEPLDTLGKVIDGYGAEITTYTRQTLGQGHDAFAAIVRMSKDREAEYFGHDFTFERPLDNEHAYHLHITRCAYAQVFAGWGLPELTGLFCRLDEAWIRAIDPDQHGVSFSRPATIGWGGQRCLFLFDRVKPEWMSVASHPVLKTVQAENS